MKRTYLFVMAILLLVGVSAVHAQGYYLTITDYEGNCSSVTFSYDSFADGPTAHIVISNGQGVILYDNGNPFVAYPADQGPAGPFTVNFTPQPVGTVLTLTISNISVEPVSVNWGCEASVEASVGRRDPGLCWDAGVTPSAIYPSGDGLVVYEMTSRTKGIFVFSITQEDLEALPDADTLTKNLEVKSSPSGLIKFYLLTSGEYQFNVGPVVNENKVFVCILNTILPTRITRYSFYMNP